jgi:ribosomal protein S27E
MNVSSPAVTQTSWWSRVPTFLKLWAGLQIASTAVLGLIFPVSEWSWSRAVGGLVIPFLLFVTMLRHSKGAWAVAVLLALLGLIFAPGFWDESPAYVISGLIFIALELGVLLSPQAREWVNQPTERKWTYTPKKQEEFLVRRCQDCGDTFPATERHPTCPSCGSTNVDPASEPML